MCFLLAASLMLVGTADEPPKIALPEGHAAYSLMTDQGAIVGFILPGSKVDIVLTEKMKNGPTKTLVIKSGLLVVAVENDLKKKNVLTLTLAVKPDDAKVLEEAAKRGVLKALLNRVDIPKEKPKDN